MNIGCSLCTDAEKKKKKKNRNEITKMNGNYSKFIENKIDCRPNRVQEGDSAQLSFNHNTHSLCE